MVHTHTFQVGEQWWVKLRTERGQMRRQEQRWRGTRRSMFDVRPVCGAITMRKVGDGENGCD